MPKDQIVALDIGTRSVVGIVAKQQGEQYLVVDCESTEHRERAMLDGQIHDIAKVTESVVQVLEQLSERNGTFEHVAIAAAGRSLRTQRGFAEIDLDITKEIDKEVTDKLEMLAIQDAQERMAQVDPIASSYYTVGHSVVCYDLDEALILNPIGHRGTKLEVEIIATFLPHIVVDSLYSVLKRAGVGVLNLTLEPIAAINVAIPRRLRLLNLALIDIGAGTSDIAISRDGTIHSYGMVASAGDRMTEVVAEEYLLDFNAAEALKIAASTEEICRYVDVIGVPHEVHSDEINAKMAPVARELARKICDKVRDLNGKAPSAVFCIGGGSLLKGLKEMIAEELGLAPERVAVKSIEQLEQIRFDYGALKGPEYITPIGIAVTAFEERDHDFIQVTVNGASIRLLNTKVLQVSDALLLTGFNARSLLSERGESIFVTVDGERREIKGEFGEPARILVNGERCGVDAPIAHKDKIQVVPAERGLPRKMRLSQLVSLDDCVYFGETPLRMAEYVAVNGINRTGEYILIDGDVIETKGIKTVADLARVVELGDDFILTKDGLLLSDRTPLERNGVYDIRRLDAELRAQIEAERKERERLLREQMPEITVYVNGRPIQIKEDAIFVDVFDAIDFDRSRPQGMLELTLNGERASYMDPLSQGDVIEIAWKQL
ncbi:MAG: cell division FtsA domain-containing protein [Bacillota bacterium]|nr:cell division FtsA domain-containing protein [Bacillota bacterium]